MTISDRSVKVQIWWEVPLHVLCNLGLDKISSTFTIQTIWALLSLNIEYSCPCYSRLRHVTGKLTLWSLSLSYQKKDRLAGHQRSFFWYPTWHSQSAYNLIVGVVSKEGLVGPPILVLVWQRQKSYGLFSCGAPLFIRNIDWAWYSIPNLMRYLHDVWIVMSELVQSDRLHKEDHFSLQWMIISSHEVGTAL